MAGGPRQAEKREQLIANKERLRPPKEPRPPVSWPTSALEKGPALAYDALRGQVPPPGLHGA